MKLNSVLFSSILFMAVVFTVRAQNTETRSPGTFTKIENGGSWDVQIIKGSTDEILRKRH
ncbi:hypothetical protein [Algoriphagus hitonicola]|uniref:Uncharacterized protein n=1 Tax=Algoriphagus hitonicola TaxID=435880 RepID=A0A1I2T6L1_9BACT|nr:hypothetical protein [Algoriphagus hitonicola]SFG58156.1 hypothetical protein SAMN04487988_105147 [Algoriphagus hitonicola]